MLQKANPRTHRNLTTSKRGLKSRLLLFLSLNSKQAKNNPIFCSLKMVTDHVGPIAQLDRASVFETEGWAFESLWDHHP